MESDSLSEPEHDLIVIGASTGGVEAIPKLVRELQADLPAAVLIALAAAPHIPHLLTAILNKVSALPAHQAVQGEAIEKGRIYVAPPDQHMKIWNEHIHLDHGPRENRHRPAIDALFRSAAALGPRAVGVILSGSLEDGTAGLQAIKDNGGMAIVQDPAEALAPEMPQNVREHVAVDFCLPLVEIGKLLNQLAQQETACAAVP